MEDLVRPRAADAGDHALVAQERVQPARFAGEDLAEPLRAEPERLRPEVRELGLGRLGREQPDSGALLRAGLGEHELGAALEARRNAGVFGPFSPARRYRRRPARHQVDEQDELAVLGREEQPLRAPLRAGEPAALERRRAAGRYVFSVAMCAGPAFSIGKAETRAVERPAPRLHLRQFRHLALSLMAEPISVARRGAAAPSSPSIASTRSPCATASRGGRRRSGGSSRSCARRRSRSRPCRSRGRAPTSTSATSRSRRPRTSPTPTQLAAVRALLAKAPARRRTTSSAAPRASRRDASSTTAPASTPACSRSAGRTAGRSRATGSPSIPCQQAHARRDRGAADGCRAESRRRSTAAASSPSRCRSSGWRGVRAARAARRRATRVAARDARAPGARSAAPGGPDTMLMQALPGWIAKGGAEGLLCAAGPDGLGLALKVEDGAGRALAARARLLPRRARADRSRTRPVSPVRNSRERGRRRACRNPVREKTVSQSCGSLLISRRREGEPGESGTGSLRS